MDGVLEYDYKKFLLIPILFLAFSSSILVLKGIELGIDLAGGTLIQLEGLKEKPSESEIEGILASHGVKSSQIRVVGKIGSPTYTVVILTKEDISEVETELISSLENKLKAEEVSTSGVGAEIGEYFFSQGKKAIVLAVSFMALVIFILFRYPVISMSMILAVLMDGIDALGLMALAGMELSLSSIAALLMVIGYSVDSNILLTTSVIKRRGGKPQDRVVKAMRTGLKMTTTTLIALLVLLFLFQGERIISGIATVLLFGLVSDLINTWLFNAGVILFLVERRWIKA
ncbi:hypothetical protein DRN46_00430 [Thermococci archaeon]|nr:MAG: hypothetical protein DRN46_00430 [Thermococci archaeon]